MPRYLQLLDENCPDGQTGRLKLSQLFNQELWGDMIQHYQAGYNECMKEVFRFMTDVEGADTNDSRCVRIMSYLQTRIHAEQLPSSYEDKLSVYSSTMFSPSNRALFQSNVPPTTMQGVFHHPYTGLRFIHRFSPYSLQNHSTFRPSSSSNFGNLECKSTYTSVNFAPRSGLPNNCNYQGPVKFSSFPNALIGSSYHNL